MCASACVAPSNIVYSWYGYRSTGTGVLTTKVLLFRYYLKDDSRREFKYVKIDSIKVLVLKPRVISPPVMFNGLIF